MIKIGNKDAIFQNEVLVKIIMHLQSFHPVRSIDLTEKQKEFSDTLDLITNKPVLYVCNVDEQSIQNGNIYTKNFVSKHKEENTLIISADIENQINGLDQSERKNYMEMIGLKKTGLDRFCQCFSS